jgi:hypothetical protein
VRMPESHSDIGEETARFQAFKDRSDELPPSWQMKTTGAKIGALAIIVIVVAIVAMIIGKVLVG